MLMLYRFWQVFVDVVVVAVFVVVFVVVFCLFVFVKLES